MHPLRLKIGSLTLEPQALLGATRNTLSAHDNVVIEAVPDGVWLKAADETQLLSAATKVREHLSADVQIGKVSVDYRETITRAMEIEGKIREIAPPAYAQMWLRIGPGEQGKGVTFTSSIVAELVPVHFIPAIRAGLREALMTGPIAGYEVTDIEVTLFDGSYHDDHSTEDAFRRAALEACKNALAKCHPVLLEPIMFVEVKTPTEVVGNVVGDLTGRRGLITSMKDVASGMLVRGKVPLVAMLGYASELAKLTDGKGTYLLKFSHYAKVPSPPRPDGDEPASMALRVA